MVSHAKYLVCTDKVNQCCWRVYSWLDMSWWVMTCSRWLVMIGSCTSSKGHVSDCSFARVSIQNLLVATLVWWVGCLLQPLAGLFNYLVLYMWQMVGLPLKIHFWKYPCKYFFVLDLHRHGRYLRPVKASQGRWDNCFRRHLKWNPTIYILYRYCHFVN